MKNSIAFKHFRKFEDFPQIDFNDITFIVGKNNSGKSTFVKAFVMVYNYLKSEDLRYLDLNQGSVELLNIVTFDRALCKTMENRQSKEYIPITVKLDNYEFFLEVTGKKESTILDVNTFRISDSISNFQVEFKPQNNHLILKYDEEKQIEESTDSEDLLQSKLAEVENQLLLNKDIFSKESIDLRIQHEKLIALQKIKPVDNQKINLEIEAHYTERSFDMIFEEVFEIFGAKYNIVTRAIQLSKQSLKNEISKIDSKIDLKSISEEIRGNFTFYKLKENDFKDFYKDFQSYINNSRIFYLPATLNKQSALLSIRDKGNDLAEVVHKYYQLEIAKNPIVDEFVKFWIKEFQIGTDIKIELINSEAYSVDIKEDEVWIPLADKGMGSIQAILLILRLASVIHLKLEKDKKETFDYFIIVEEPELNLHPALQSKLCDMIFAVKDVFKIKFIIETHSEYIIRRSQVINLLEEYELDTDEMNPTPFSTIYFNSDSKSEVVAYNMHYQLDGTFDNNFGSGFFDASSSSTLELIRLKRKKGL